MNDALVYLLMFSLVGLLLVVRLREEGRFVSGSVAAGLFTIVVTFSLTEPTLEPMRRQLEIAEAADGK